MTAPRASTIATARRRTAAEYASVTAHAQRQAPHALVDRTSIETVYAYLWNDTARGFRRELCSPFRLARSPIHDIGPHHLVVLVLEHVAVKDVPERLVPVDGRAGRKIELDQQPDDLTRERLHGIL